MQNILQRRTDSQLLYPFTQSAHASSNSKYAFEILNIVGCKACPVL